MNFTFYELLVTNIPETIVIIIFLRFYLKADFNIIVTTMLVSFFMSTGKYFIHNEIVLLPFNTIVYCSIIYILSRKSISKIFSGVLCIAFFCIAIDSIVAIPLCLFTNHSVDQIRSNFSMYFLIVMYSALIKSLALYVISQKAVFKK